MNSAFLSLARQLELASPIKRHGLVSMVSNAGIDVTGLSKLAKIGDLVRFEAYDGAQNMGEVIRVDETTALIMAYEQDVHVRVGDRVAHLGAAQLYPTPEWAGRVIDAFGNSLDGNEIAKGHRQLTLRAKPLPAAERRGLGQRLTTGLAAFDTMLPLVSGQRIGIFAGSGVGKTTLLADLARGVDADHVVIGLIGERGREVRDFVEDVLGPEGMRRTVVVAATSDTSPLVKRRAAWTATAVAEGYRDAGKRVLLIIDSLTRFAEAHREIALTAGEPPSLRAYPPSTAHMLATLTERAGTGTAGKGDITAVYSVLVAGSDMEEPVSDIVRGLLDGHIILTREIAERGRFPAIDIRRSVSRALPQAATAAENELISRTRKLIADYEDAEVLIQTGLYAKGSDVAIDEAIDLWPEIDELISKKLPGGPEESFEVLRAILEGDSQETKADLQTR